MFLTVAVFCLMITGTISAQEPEELNDGIKTAEAKDAGISISKLIEMDSAIVRNEFKNITSILIARDGKLVYEKYYNGFDKNSLHDTRSATKSITSILIGLAIDNKFIPSEKTAVFQYFEKEYEINNPDSRKNKITIEDLLTMSSLLECDDGNMYSSGNEERMYLTEDYIKFALDLPIKGFPAWAQKPEETLYGRSFSYCTAGTVLLGGIIERSTKMKVQEFADKFLFSPLGITNYQWQITPTGLPMTGGGLRLSSRDFMKLILLCSQKGLWNDKQIISNDWIVKSTTPHSDVRENTDYGYLFWLEKFGAGDPKYSAYYMTGTGGSKIAVFPNLNLKVVITSNWYGGRGKAHEQSRNILNKFILPAIGKLD